MILKDKIYGIENIKENVLVDLINSSPVQRLKGIAQFGIPDEYYHKKGFSRYEHSVGVFILLRKLNAGLEEQLAGLLHDVSHTAFSHVVDGVFGDLTKEDYQDKRHEDFIKNSCVKNILEKYKLDYKKISKLENFSLLEREAPSLCADRLDYSLRELEMDKGFNFVNNIFLDLENKNNQIVFKTKEIAEIFAKEYMLLQKENWGGDQARTRYYILSNILKKALDNKIILFDDLDKTDEDVLEKLNSCKEEYILKNLNLLRNNLSIFDSDEGIELKKKFRYIDPEISINGSFKKLSELSNEYKKIINLEKQNSQKIKKVKYFVKK
ncbi:MAG: HD domain-containing protein [Nanoarchaeota archaeon]|nr:HD domain-containing protein [Nanoarchaeota archaeon]